MSDRTNHFAGKSAMGVVLLALSAPAFGQSLTTDAVEYVRGEPLTATWSGAAPLTAFSFVAIADADQPDDEWNFAQIIGFAASGEYTWDHIPQGCNLEIRLYRAEGDVILRSAPFDVECGIRDATVTTDAGSYFVGDDITVDWDQAAGYALDWVAISTAGSADDFYLDFEYTDPVGFTGPYAGSMARSSFRYKAIDNLPPGEYEARLMLNNDFVVQARTSFTVAVDPADPSTLTTDRASYTPRTAVEVCWTDAPGNLLDWVAIARRALPSTNLFSYVDIYGDPTWTYIDGDLDGCRTIPNIKELGQYAARGFEDNTYVPFVNQTLFEVNFAPSAGPIIGSAVSTDDIEYFKGEPIEVSFSGATGNADDLLLLADATFAPDDPAGVVAWTYFDQVGLDGLSDGSYTFYEFLANGTYVARGMSADSFSGMGESDPFTVIPDPDTLPAVWTTPTCVPPDAFGIDVFYINVATPPAGVWVGIWDEGADRYAFSYAWDYVPTGTPEGDGFFWFSGTVGVEATLPVGRYEVRLMNSQRRIGYTGFFDVDPDCPTAIVGVDRAFYQVGDLIEVDWDGMENNPEYYVGIFDSALDPAVDEYQSELATGGAETGFIEFDALTPGTYTANGFHQYSRVVVGQSDSFIVCPDGQVPDCTNTCQDETIVNPFECIDTGPIDSGDSGFTITPPDSGDSADSGGDSGTTTTTTTTADSGIEDSGSTIGETGLGDSGATTADSGFTAGTDSGATGGDSGTLPDSGGLADSGGPPGPDSGFPTGDSGTPTTTDSGFMTGSDSGSVSGDSGGTPSDSGGMGDSGGVSDSGTTTTTTTVTGDSGHAYDSGRGDSGVAADSGRGSDSGHATDSGGTTSDSGHAGDSGLSGDSGFRGADSGVTDSGFTGDSGGATDSGTGDSGSDSGTPVSGDSGVAYDSGRTSDSGLATDSGRGDSGVASDSGAGDSGIFDSGATTTTTGDSGAGDSGSDSGGIVDSGFTGDSGGDSGAGDSGGDSGL